MPQPDFLNGVLQAAIEGTGMIYSFEEPDAPERQDLQNFESSATAAS